VAVETERNGVPLRTIATLLFGYEVMDFDVRSTSLTAQAAMAIAPQQRAFDY
jgi:hypothetical protein